ncbi:MAG: 2-amino-4-hydroxy-6-hydroxymethyldihydropteridine diphosphokinase [Salinivirgaceae bacterium]|nr:2-amino-4-hydroxy-6-hydroxymethyldihydropteridine diphosphokinase [Salinivirgaceae bacterium]
MASVYLCLGGNEGNTLAVFAIAIDLINSRIGNVVKKSALYETEPWGFECSQNFVNQVVAVQTNLQPIDVLHICLQVEAELGRVRHGVQYCSRVIDIDILLIDDLVINEPELIVPHPRMLQRQFVLQPLNNIAPMLNIPNTELTVSRALEICTDTLGCKLLQVNTIS